MCKGVELSGEGIFDRGAEFVVEGVDLVKEFFAETVVVGLLSAFGLADTIPQVIVQIHGLVEQASNSVNIFSLVDSQHERAVIDKCTDHVFDVFLNVSKIHSVLN